MDMNNPAPTTAPATSPGPRPSQALLARAQQRIPGGVNSPVRSFRAVNLPPIIAQRAEGAYLWDVDGNRYLDCLLSWGAVMLGHAHPALREAIARAAADGCGYGLTTPVECEMAEILCEAVPSLEQVRMVNSGTEAVMSAVRLCRGYTGRNKVLVFEGCYHGHHDALLAQAGSGLATFGLPRSDGVPAAATADTLVARYNDLDSVESFIRLCGDDLACILVEPVAGNMGVVAPADGFLAGLRQLCDRCGALLVFDEVITGFRLAWGGAQELFGVSPDVTTLGKIIGGGLPVGAFGGRREIMSKLAPQGAVYQAGTLAGNPVVLAAGVAALRELRRTQPYAALDRTAAQLTETMATAARTADIPLTINRVGSMFTAFFTADHVTDMAAARTCDTELYAAFFGAMARAGVLLPPSQWESAFLSAAHLPDNLAAEIATRAATALSQLSVNV